MSGGSPDGLRVGVKIDAGIDPDVARVNLKAQKVFREGIDSDHYYDCNQEEANPECVHPTICPVTYPSYSTPRWLLKDLDVPNSAGVTFSQLEHLSSKSKYDCNFVTFYTGDMTPFIAHQVFFPLVIGEIASPFSVVASQLPDGSWEWVTDNSVPMPPELFDDMNVRLETEVFATEDPCIWLVRAELHLTHFVQLATDPLELGDPNEQLFGQYIALPIYKRQSNAIQFAKRVPAWRGPPPEIAFGADELQPGEPDLFGDFIQTSIGLFKSQTLTIINQNGNYVAEITYENEEVPYTAISFKIVPDTEDKIPHPVAT